MNSASELNIDRNNNQTDFIFQTVVKNYLETLNTQIISEETSAQPERLIFEQKMYQIRVLSVHDSDSEEEREGIAEKNDQEVGGEETSVIKNIDRHEKRLVNLQKKEEELKNNQIQIERETQQDHCEPFLHSKIVKHVSTKPIVAFKRSHKVMKSQLSKKTKVHQSRFFQASSHSKQNHRPMVLPSFKFSSSYNQLQDKMLVQYFYPRQKNIADQDCSEQRSRLQHERQSKAFIKSKTERRYDFSKIMKEHRKGGFQTINDCGRRANFTDYDLISCRQSLSPHKIYPQAFSRLDTLTERDQTQLRASEVQVLQHRMVALESQVLGKVPYLLKMGVNFRRVQRR